MANIHSARDSYEREAELRRQTQEEMASLRKRLHDQAQRLLASQAAQKEENHLVRRSAELRTSVVGMERELSTLRAERDIAMAEMRGFKRISRYDRPSESLSIAESENSQNDVDPATLSATLSEQLEQVKENHRTALEDLAIQREQVNREISELTRQRDNMQEENTLYETQGKELVKQNAELMQQLTATKQSLDQMSRFNINSFRGKKPQPGSPSQTGSSTVFDSIPESTSLSSARRVETTHSQPVRKFKWGKGRPAEVKSSVSNPTHKGQQSSIASTTKATSTDLPMRRHIFQPTSILKPIRCEHCLERMWGLQELRCTSCGVYCHSKCQPHYHIQCNSAPLPTDDGENAPSGLFGTDLTRQAQLEEKDIPNIVTACVTAVETFGMYLGLVSPRH